MFRRFIMLSTAAACVPAFLTAQAQSDARFHLTGVVYDSLHDRPLKAAMVVLGGNKSAISDDHGAFSFDSVSAGTYVVSIQHDLLDSIGLYTVTNKVVVTNARDVMRVGIPSFKTIWRMACGSAPAPADSGLLFGTVRTADGRQPRSPASIEASWLDLAVGKNKAVQQKLWKLTTSTDTSGSYALCGVPLSSGVHVTVAADSSATAPIDLQPLGATKVARRDIRLSLVGADSAFGELDGLVTTTDGRPLADATIDVDNGASARTGATGRFHFRRLPAGTRQIEARSIGLDPKAVNVDVLPSDTARVTIVLERVTHLDSVNVLAKTWRSRELDQIEIRKKQGLGYFKDSLTIGNKASLVGAFAEMPISVLSSRGGAPALILGSLATGCLAHVFVDGRRITQRELGRYSPTDLATVELYTKYELIPLEYRGQIPERKPPGEDAVYKMRCGAMLIWTKAFKG